MHAAVRQRTVASSAPRVLAVIGATVTAVAVGVSGIAVAASGFVSDDFSASALNSRWQVTRPLGVGSAAVAGSGTGNAHLALSVPAGASHDPWTRLDVVRATQAVDDTDVHVEAKWDSVPSLGYQMQGLVFEADATTFARFEVHHTGSALKLFASTTVAGTPTTRISKALPALTRVWLRAQRTGSSWTLRWSGDGSAWSTAGSFTQALTVARVGPYVGNYRSSGDAPAYTAKVDYVFDVSAPINPEDGGAPDPTPTPTATPPSGSGPVIDVWYGSPRTFRHTQTWVNLLGRVTDPDGVSSLSYRLNGGASRALSIGPNHRRLQDAGDFNADIAYADLVAGANAVAITATDRTGATSTRTVTVNRSGAGPALPHTVDWSATQPVGAQAQPVDGRWSTGSGDLRTQITGYDRIVTLGDLGWRDYEVRVPVTAHRFGPGAYTHLSGAPLIGLGMRWRGHTSVDSSQPAWGWYPTGAFAWYRFYATGGKFELLGNNGSPAKRPQPGFAIGTTYTLKVRAQTVTGATRYSVKLWPAGAAEPAAWLATIDETEGPATGSVALIAHQLDATFGTVTVTAI